MTIDATKYTPEYLRLAGEIDEMARHLAGMKKLLASIERRQAAQQRKESECANILTAKTSS